LETWLSPHNDIRIFFFYLKHSWTKTAFWDDNNKEWCKWCKLVSSFLSNNAYGLPVLTKNTRCPNQVFYVSSIYRLFVIDRGWKRDSLQIMIFVYVFSTWDILELRTRFETWIEWNVVNGLSLVHPPYLISLLPYMCSQRVPNDQINYFIFDSSIYRLFVIKRGWKRDSPNKEIRTC
jgi:hypothetical protein